METINCDFKISVPFTAIVSGKSMAGKSWLIARMIDEHVFSGQFSDVILVRERGEFQDGYEKIKKKYKKMLDFESFAEFETFFVKNVENLRGFLILIDDLDDACYNSPLIAKICKYYCHHYKISLFILTQTLFMKAKHHSEISRNVSYYIVFPNFRDQVGLQTLGYQIGMSKFLTTCFKKMANLRIRPYLVINFKPVCDERLRFTTGYLSDEDKMVFMPI